VQAVPVGTTRVVVTMPFAIVSVNTATQTIEWIYEAGAENTLTLTAVTSGADPVAVPLGIAFGRFRGFFALVNRQRILPTTPVASGSMTQFAMAPSGALVIQHHQATYAVNVTTGSILWATALPSSIPNPYNYLSGSTVARIGAYVAVLRSNGVYLLDSNGNIVRNDTFTALSNLCTTSISSAALYILNNRIVVQAVTCAYILQLDGPSYAFASPSGNNLAIQPTTAGAQLILFPQGNGGVVAVDLTGRTVWSAPFTIAVEADSSANYGLASGGAFVYGFTSGLVTATYGPTGQIVWTYAVNATIAGPPLCTPRRLWWIPPRCL
jgi:outer membrane protein assembly factor BamB